MMFHFKCLLRIAVISARNKFPNKFQTNRYFSVISNKKRLHFDTDDLKKNEISIEELEIKKGQDNWEEEFGTLTNLKEAKSFDEKTYEDDLKEEDETERPYRRLASEGRRHTPDWYGRKMEKLGRKGMVYEAIQLLEQQMLVEDRVRPNTYVFNTLIGILGRAGYAHKAFKTFNMMKKYGLLPTPATYTSLFNCCANCPSRLEGLERARRLRELIVEKNEELNLITYQSIIKAFSRCGDTQTAFQVADEAVSVGHRLTPHTFSFLLMASVSDRPSGLSLALKLCGMMRRMKLKMNTYHFNLLLRAVRDCGVGTRQQFELLLHKNTPINDLQDPSRISHNDSIQVIDHHHHHHHSLNFLLLPHYYSHPQKDLTASQSSDLTHNHNISSNFSLLSPSTHLQTTPPLTNTNHPLPNQSSITNSQPSTITPTITSTITPNLPILPPRLPQHRLSLIGGIDGVLQCMEAHKTTPTIKTFALLLESLPPNIQVEAALLDAMSNRYHLKLDTTFCNLLIRKRNIRGNFKAAKDVLVLMAEQRIGHDMKTFGCLSMGCSSLHRALSLLSDMQKLNLMPNAEILDILLAQSAQNFRYKRALLCFVRENRLRLFSRTLGRVEEDIQNMRKTLLHQERQLKDTADKNILSVSPASSSLSSASVTWVNSEGRRDFEGFMMVYKQWLRQIPLEPTIHPFDLYRQPTMTKQPQN